MTQLFLDSSPPRKKGPTKTRPVPSWLTGTFFEVFVAMFVTTIANISKIISNEGTPSLPFSTSHEETDPLLANGEYIFNVNKEPRRLVFFERPKWGHQSPCLRRPDFETHPAPPAGPSLHLFRVSRAVALAAKALA